MSARLPQPNRLDQGGIINRDRPVVFTFDRRVYQGYEGDSLASALLANGVKLFGRSFKYHRPRGILGAGPEEPNALVEVDHGPAERDPNHRATMLEIYEGLETFSQNHFGPLGMDLMEVNDLISRFLPAGFYYKTFFFGGLQAWYRLYEPIIRRAAGLGRPPLAADPHHYDKVYTHADTLIVGGGIAGLTTALSLAKAGQSVVVCEERDRMGGSALWQGESFNGEPGEGYIAHLCREIEAAGGRLLPRTTVFGVYDAGTFGAVERCHDHLAKADRPPHTARMKYHRIQARNVVYATGAIERSVGFKGNDRPGVMLASAGHTFLGKYGVRVGERVSLFTTHDGGYGTAAALSAAGAEVTVLDARTDGADVGIDGVRVIKGVYASQAHGRMGVRRVDYAGASSGSIEADALLVAGGWNPTVHLTSHTTDRRQSKPVYDPDLLAFLPPELADQEAAAGSVTGAMSTADCLATAQAASLKLGGRSVDLPTVEQALPVSKPTEMWAVPGAGDAAFLDMQNDATVKDVKLSAQEGFKSVEHMKRYTTLGMATDQGKTSNVTGLALLAAATGRDIAQVGTTTFRPPYTPIPIGVLAGHHRQRDYAPFRYSPVHAWAQDTGATFMEAGLWMRPAYYTRPGDKDWLDSAVRETRATRDSLGITDVSTLGKIDIQGPDAAEFLNRLYTNGWKTLPVGKARYGLMLREDGMVFDDGTTSRLGENHFYMTTTTAHAAGVMAHMEFMHQSAWPDLRVAFASVTDQWGGLALAGPNARACLAKLFPELDVSNDSLPFMGVVETQWQGYAARLFRISFSGELAYEVAVPADTFDAFWRAALDAGAEWDITPYGLEALNIMRIEKGHVTGAELDGRVSMQDVGLGKMVSSKKDFVGRAMAEREGFSDPERGKMLGLVATNPGDKIIGGGIIFDSPDGPFDHTTMLGYVTSVAQYSPLKDRAIALAFVKNAADWHDTKLYVVSHVHDKSVMEVRAESPHFYDPQNKKVMA